MSEIKTEYLNTLINNQSLEGMKQLSINELDLISVLIGTCLGLELAKLTPVSYTHLTLPTKRIV